MNVLNGGLMGLMPALVMAEMERGHPQLSRQALKSGYGGALN